MSCCGCRAGQNWIQVCRYGKHRYKTKLNMVELVELNSAIDILFSQSYFCYYNRIHLNIDTSLSFS